MLEVFADDEDHHANTKTMFDKYVNQMTFYKPELDIYKYYTCYYNNKNSDVLIQTLKTLASVEQNYIEVFK